MQWSDKVNHIAAVALHSRRKPTKLHPFPKTSRGLSSAILHHSIRPKSDFISTEDWPSGSLDLNPLDYKLWSVLEDIDATKDTPTLNP
ncbi:hypothetical protein ILUMI_20789 [Ignelater luminosus]|uniref:Uncharacterized protein n=1 Tax=Ignelater luminosus TaxID=2038154 RepID=A0A8K0G489_IGNLU|nr:hypothetical protein ILUMI_20789 [Ignelater luminosus]